MSSYARPNLGRTVLALATSVLPFLGLWVLMYFALQVSYLLVLALAVPAAGFVLRTFILFHDCAHGSLLRGRRANARLGAVLGLMVFTPFGRWRHEHTLHHATAGDLDRRGVGDINTLTVSEYDARPWRGRLAYRLFLEGQKLRARYVVSAMGRERCLYVQVAGSVPNRITVNHRDGDC